MQSGSPERESRSFGSAAGAYSLGQQLQQMSAHIGESIPVQPVRPGSFAADDARKLRIGGLQQGILVAQGQLGPHQPLQHPVAAVAVVMDEAVLMGDGDGSGIAGGLKLSEEVIIEGTPIRALLPMLKLPPLKKLAK